MQEVHLCTINVNYGTGNFVSYCVSLGLLIMCPFCWDLKAYMWFYTHRKTPYVQSTAFEALVVDLQCYKKAYSLYIVLLKSELIIPHRSRHKRTFEELGSS